MTRASAATNKHVGTSTEYAVLIVDDEFGLAEILRDMLAEHGYDVMLAINGRLALDILDERQIDLVITDMMMPVMDGVELAAAIKNSDVHRSIPIVLMTSLPSANPPGNDLYDAVLRKPFTPELLLTTMRACLARRPAAKGRQAEPGSGPRSLD
jgi:DNA-binding response OmpR family regulator